jgi:hypothetical protein
MKRIAIAALVSAMICSAFATWLAPKLITYWYAPPEVAGGTNVPNCTPYVTAAMHHLVLFQLGATAAGAVVGLIIGVLLRRRTPPAVPASTAPAATPASANKA